MKYTAWTRKSKISWEWVATGPRRLNRPPRIFRSISAIVSGLKKKTDPSASEKRSKTSRTTFNAGSELKEKKGMKRKNRSRVARIGRWECQAHACDRRDACPTRWGAQWLCKMDRVAGTMLSGKFSFRISPARLIISLSNSFMSILLRFGFPLTIRGNDSVCLVLYIFSTTFLQKSS